MDTVYAILVCCIYIFICEKSLKFASTYLNKIVVIAKKMKFSYELYDIRTQTLLPFIHASVPIYPYDIICDVINTTFK